jgi:hypothetical protein
MEKTPLQKPQNSRNYASVPPLSSGTKIYIPSATKTKMNLVPFSFRAVWAVRLILKISAILLKHPAFEVARA